MIWVLDFVEPAVSHEETTIAVLIGMYYSSRFCPPIGLGNSFPKKIQGFHAKKILTFTFKRTNHNF